MLNLLLKPPGIGALKKTRKQDSVLISYENHRAHTYSHCFVYLFLLTMANCTGPNQPLPKTPPALRLNPLERAVYRDGFRAGRTDHQRLASADHKRHPFPPASEEISRCGYIKGLTYNWIASGQKDRIRRDFPTYLDAYLKQTVHWGDQT